MSAIHVPCIRQHINIVMEELVLVTGEPRIIHEHREGMSARMSERLKGWVGYRRRLPMGTYATADFEWGIEFWQDQMTLEEAHTDLIERVGRLLHRTGLFRDGKYDKPKP